MHDYQRVVRYSKILLEQSSITDDDRVDIYLTLGDAELHINGDFIKAEKCFMDVQQIALATSPCNYHILVLFYESMALLQIEKNNYTIALELLSKVLDIALDYSFESNIIIRTYSNLGLVYRKILNFDRACENYELALNIITQSNTLPKLHPLHPVIHNNLAYTKQLQNDYDEALKHYDLALEIERKSLPSIHSITATTLCNIGLLYTMKRENEKALDTYQKVLVMVNEIFGDDHPRLGVVFHNLGDLFLRTGQYEQAKEYLNKALKIRLNSPDVDADDRAATFTSLGLVNLRLGSFNKSLYYCFQALYIRSKIPETATNNIFDTYSVLARYYLSKSDYCQALRYCELAQYRCPYKSIKLVSVHQVFGDVLYQMEQFDEAISHYQTSIDIQLQLAGRNNVCLAELYLSIGIVYGSKEEINEALKCFVKGRSLAFEDSSLMANLHQATADIYLELKQFDKVVEHLDQVKMHCDKLALNKSIPVAKMSRTIGILNLKKGNFDDARTNLMEALMIFEKESSEFQLIIADTYLHLGCACEKLNKIDQALEIFEKVKTMNSIIYPKNHSYMAGIYHRLSVLLLDKNLLQESLTNAEHALEAAKSSYSINYNELARIHDTLTRIHLKRKDFARAHLEIQNGFATRQMRCPNDLPLSQIHLANAYTHENRTKEAIDLLNDIHEDQLLSVHHYTSAQLSKDMAAAYYNLKQYESALRILQFTLSHITDGEHYLEAEAHFLMGTICWKLGDKPQTLEHLQQALIVLDKKNTQVVHARP
ncbi:unnamed protein product [Rotaria sp. Silwood1]|nr:unnamed protein product [Rotaria sp. Silwood1]